MGISSVTSEALQLKLRQLLPSQQGFGTDLSASDTIIPIIDLTASAEGSDVPEFLQTSLALGSQTGFQVNNGILDIATTPGFYRIIGTSVMRGKTTAGVRNQFLLDDGTTAKAVWITLAVTDSAENSYVSGFDFNIYLAAGEKCTASSNDALAYLAGSIRQIADNNGQLVQPVGFSPQ